jgi:hypothetical protein
MEVLMPAASIVVLIIAFGAVVILAGAAYGVSTRRRRLRVRFGPEYDRVVAERRSRLLGEAELDRRERRVQRLLLEELDERTRDRYAAQWAEVEQRLVHAPAEAVADAQSLMESMMRAHGYPVADHEQAVADLSVEHGWVVDRYRSAHDISVKAASGQATTEELRVAVVGYLEFSRQLLARGGTSFTTRQHERGLAP